MKQAEDFDNYNDYYNYFKAYMEGFKDCGRLLGVEK